MRVLFTTQPAYGHLHPMVPLAQAVRDAGHEVRVASSASFREQVGAAGLTATTAGIDWLESELAVAFPEFMEHALRGEGARYVQSEVFAWHTPTAMAADVVRLARDWPVDLVVRDPWELGGAVAAAELGVPCVVHGIGSSANMDDFVELAQIRLRQLAAETRLADDLRWIGGDLYLDPCPPCLRPEALAPVVKRVRDLRAVPFDTTGGAPQGPAWLADLGRVSPVERL